MAFYRNLFPNLTDSDFLAPSVSNSSTTQEFAYNWAQHGNTDTIPADKLPDISYGDTWTYSGADFDLAAFITSWNGAATTGTAFPTGLNNDQADGSLALHNGDVIIITDTTPDPDLVATYLYTGSQSYLGGNDSTRSPGGSAADSVDVASGNFHQISTSASGVSGIIGGNSIGVTGSGTITVNLDDSIHASDGTDTTPKVFTVGRDVDTQGTPVAQSTTIAGTGVTIDSAAVATLDGATGASVTSAAVSAVTGGTGATITATTGELDITASAANVDINAGTTVAIDAGSTASLTGATGLSLAATANELDLTAGGAIDINAGTNVTIDAGGEDTNVTITSGGGGGVASLNYDVDNHINVSASGVLIDGTLTLDGLGSGTTDLTAGNNVLVVDSSGVVGERNVANLGVGAYTPTTVADAGAGTPATASVTTSNVVMFIEQQTAAALTLTVPTPGTAGTWIKVVNNANLNATTNADGQATLTTVTLTTGSNDDFVGVGTSDALLQLDDQTANFELISDGTRWNIMAT